MLQSYGLGNAPANPFPNYLLFWKPFPIFLIFWKRMGIRHPQRLAMSADIPPISQQTKPHSLTIVRRISRNKKVKRLIG